MPDTPKQCAVTLVPEGRHCKHPIVPGTDYCRQHQRAPEPTEEDRLLILRTLAAPGVWSLSRHEISSRILGMPAGDGRTREHRQWILCSLTLDSAIIGLHDQGLIYEAVPADGYHSSKLRLTDAGRDYLLLSELVG
jgi:hypothetical protein